jgi:hypothetical protein
MQKVVGSSPISRSPKGLQIGLFAFACQGRSKSGPLAPVEKWTTTVLRRRSKMHPPQLAAVVAEASPKGEVEQ